MSAARESHGLIFDVGANNGADSAFYLRKGFRVVAVEPNPELCALMRDSLADYVADGRLTIEESAIAGAAGRRQLHISRYSEWSSLRANHKNRGEWDGGVLEVPSMTLDQLIDRHGQPYYIKIDIEGLELNALRAYGQAGQLADYVSIEVNWDWRACVHRLAALGYRSFQLVRQGRGFLPPPPMPAREGDYAPQTFEDAMTGVFGRELPGPWLGRWAFRDAAESTLREDQERVDRGEAGGWYDIHVRLGSSAEGGHS